MLIHAGDFLAEWGQGPMEFLDFLEWMKELPHRKKLLTAGHVTVRLVGGCSFASDVYSDYGVEIWMTSDGTTVCVPADCMARAH